MRRIWLLSGTTQWAEIEKDERLWLVTFYLGDTVLCLYSYVYLREAEMALAENGYQPCY